MTACKKVVMMKSKIIIFVDQLNVKRVIQSLLKIMITLRKASRKN